MGKFRHLSAFEPLVVPLLKGVVQQADYSITRLVPRAVSTSCHAVEVFLLIIKQVLVCRTSHVPKIYDFKPTKYNEVLLLLE